MSDYISKSEAERILREYADNVGCSRGEYVLANGILKAVGRLRDIPTVDEKEIIRKPFERVVECLNEKLINADLECASWKDKSSALFRCADAKRIAYVETIEMVKEECGISE